MKKNAVYASSLCALAALLAFTACKKSSSSSSNGSAAGAASSLSSLGFSGGAGTLSLKPHTSSNPCSTGSIALNPSQPTLHSTSSSCTAPDGTTSNSNELTVSESFTEIMSSCTSGGYTFNGSLTFTAPASGQTFVVCESTNPNGPYKMSGSLNFNGTPTVNGNGITLSGTTNITLDMTDSNGSFSGSVSGEAFGQTIPSTSF